MAGVAEPVTNMHASAPIQAKDFSAVMQRVVTASILQNQEPNKLELVDAYFAVTLGAHTHIAAALRSARDNLEENRTPVAANATFHLLQAADEMRRARTAVEPGHDFSWQLRNSRSRIDQALVSLCIAVADEVDMHLSRWDSELTKPWTYQYLSREAPRLRANRRILFETATAFKSQSIPPNDKTYYVMLASLLPQVLQQFAAIGGSDGLKKRMKERRWAELTAIATFLAIGAALVGLFVYSTWTP